MAIKRKILCAMLFIFSACFLSAQDGGFFVEFAPRFIQRLIWTESQGAIRYEVLIERSENGQFTGVLQEFTPQPFIEVSLHPGTYRYRVIPYDILNRPGPGSDWGALEIHPALNPELDDFFPRLIDLGDNEDEYELTISGRNISSQAQFFLRRFGDAERLAPDRVQISLEETEARISFRSGLLTEGYYQIYARNPGGLETAIEFLTIVNIPAPPPGEMAEEEPKLEWYIGTAMIPFIPLNRKYDFSSDFSPFDLALRLGMVSNAQGFINLGIELTASLYSINDPGTILVESNLLLQKLFFGNKAGFTLRFGMGLSLPLDGDKESEQQESPLDTRAIFANAGLSVIWQPLRHFYAEAGVIFSYFFIMENHASVIRPWAGLGVRF